MERLRNHDGRHSRGETTQRRARAPIEAPLEASRDVYVSKKVFFFPKHPEYNPVEGGQLSEANKLFALGAAKFGKESTQAGI